MIQGKGMKDYSPAFVVVIVFASFIISGCTMEQGSANLAETTSESVSNKFDNIHNKSDAMREFGRPFEVKASGDGNDVWVYMYTKSHLYPGSAYDPRNKENYRKLEIIFNPDGSLSNYYFTNGLN